MADANDQNNARSRPGGRNQANPRNRNNIQGPQSALTSYLAANNISARQIQEDYRRRIAEAAAQRRENGEDDEDDLDDDDMLVEAATRSRKRKRQAEVIEELKKNKRKAVEKKKPKGKGKGKKKKDSDDEVVDDDSDFVLDYQKKKPLPGQFENCEICEKRFTVTPYSKTGSDGGLVCTKCGKDLEKQQKVSKPTPKKPNGEVKRRRKIESERMDGIVRRGAKSLVQICIDTVMKYHDEVDSFGATPDHIVQQLCVLFAKQRVLNSRSLPLFLRPDMEAVEVFDCANLKTEDFQRIFAEAFEARAIKFENAYQFKDTTVDYMIEKATKLEYIQIYAANLVSSEKWSDLFKAKGATIKTLKLKWLDASFTDEQVADMASFCPNISRLKLEYCWKIGAEALDAIASMTNLEHLSLHMIQDVPNENLIDLINAVGPKLKTLSLRDFKDVDEDVLIAIHSSCDQLKKLRITGADLLPDEDWARMFQTWNNSPLEYLDLSHVRSVDNALPDGPPDEARGVASEAFAAMMQHSGSMLRHLNVASCRHISIDTLREVFDGEKLYPNLADVDLSFVHEVDDVVLAGLFRSAGKSLKKLAVFSCFGITSDCIVPRGVVVVGAPRISMDDEGIEVYGAADMQLDKDTDMGTWRNNIIEVA